MEPIRTGTGRLYIVATPIGNLADLSARARETLAAADHILAEDTRRARILLAHVEVATRPLSLHAHNEAGRVARALQWLGAGDSVALVSDAGTPLLSDPGERLVNAAIVDGHEVVPVPGPSAVLAGLVVSGLPCVPFTFMGFPPRKAGKRARALERVIDATETTVLFESPSRLAGLLDDLAVRAEPGRRIAVCRELTKVHEELLRGTLSQLAGELDQQRGEFVVVVAGRGDAPAVDEESLRTEIIRLLETGHRANDVAKLVADSHHVAKRDVYKLVLKVAKGQGPGDDGSGI